VTEKDALVYPHVTQPQTRRQALARELHAVRERARAGRDAAVTRPHAGPPRYKLALLTWAGAYALITLTLALLGPVMASWPLALRTLVLSVTMVVALTWFVMPRLTSIFRVWLSPSA
jgi:antibiotic biosynthesis monooxygenase (ABM) superfamily enzyme